MFPAFVAAACGCDVSAPDPRTSGYMYEDTVKLVRLVEDAAARIEKHGTAAFREFAVKDSRWFNRYNYLFVYSPAGVSLFHPLLPDFVGKNLIDFRDIDGRPLIRQIVAVADSPGKDAHGWVFYSWEVPTQFQTVWKSDYVRKAIAPDGTVMLVGSGSNDIKVEKAFVVDRVAKAARLLQAEGKEKAFKAILDSSSDYQFLDTRIFVLDSSGRTLVDPALPTFRGRDLSGFRDAIGRPVIKEIMEKLSTTDEAWAQFLWPRQGAFLPQRKLLYCRKVKVGNEVFYLGLDFHIETPIWMK
jgi:signal transduction histidine kinase